jgi:prepilin-type N-terminal cleavage/methylation domain-containing protein
MKKKYAFTFIEIMIAIVIFSIWILAVLNLVTNNLKSMDQNNLKLHATLLAKEWIELVYNLRDSNVQKELSWNCIINKDMYLWDYDQLSNQIWWWNQSDFENVICDWYFDTGSFLQIWFSPDFYIYNSKSEMMDNFYDIYEKNKLFLYKSTEWENIFWYWYSGDSIWEDTNFARYLSFKPVKEWDNFLPQDKIMKVESHVLYMKWGATGEVVFESFIWNY